MALPQLGVVGFFRAANGFGFFQLLDRDFRALGRFLQPDSEPVDFLRGRAVLAAQRFDLTGQLRHALAAIGDRADRGPVRALRGLHPLFEIFPAQHGFREKFAGLHDGFGQLLLALRGLFGLGEQLLRVTTAGRRGDVGRKVPLPFDRQPHGAAQPLGERGQLVPGLLRDLQPRRVLGERSLQLGLFGGHDFQRLLDLGAALPGGALVGLVALNGLALGDQVVGEQPEPGVAQVGLHRLGLAGDLGLFAQRFQLAAQLGGEVGEPVEVALHVGELAQGLLFALAVLEDARGLLDERAPLLGLRLQDRRELALPDDDVHLAADAGVREQLLHVHQPAAVAVDLVLARAVAEHPAGDGDLGVLDRQRAVGVVDGERDLGAAERGAARGAGEDDVFHLAAAQVFRALGAHDPAQRVEDVRLSGAVRADHAGDAGFEAQRGRRGEGLEALERQAFQVHVLPTPLGHGYWMATGSPGSGQATRGFSGDAGGRAARARLAQDRPPRQPQAPRQPQPPQRPQRSANPFSPPLAAVQRSTT
ncbi:hypothetical protein A4R44_06830 [Amycolatopsis sp. M39]|nr:hypothetical protein A4R44_06830 [Amycolatopsis sp. M39]